MVTGQILRVISTDPGSVCDMAAFAAQTGNQLLEQGSENSKFVFHLRKARTPVTANDQLRGGFLATGDRGSSAASDELIT